MSERARVILKSGKDQSLRRYHPWVFSGAIKKIHGVASEGELVDVYDNQDEYLATGHYQQGSITVRVIQFGSPVIGSDFWRKRLEEAWKLREAHGLTGTGNTSVFRWINGEGDGLPGLIVDFYNGVAVVQMHAIGMYRSREAILEAMKSVAGDRLKAVYDKSEGTLPRKPGIEPVNGYLWGTGAETGVLENGLHFAVNWQEGQKTGFFIDQRENRKLLAAYARDKAVLNMFCYTGGFSVYALQGGASLVHSVDSSARAIELTDKNVGLNFPGTERHSSFAADAFQFLEDIKDRYDLIILDPPAFAKHQNALKNALQGYKRLNQKAFEQIRPGGILFTFSCSQAVSRENFRKSVFAAAANARRNVRILHQLSQPPDHPVSIFHPEGEYLKGLVLEVS
ncbi:MAG: class I SAM-dependent rRNA methyltransferase [Bacteroidota bacterium]